jgi:hypothetical protein
MLRSLRSAVPCLLWACSEPLVGTIGSSTPLDAGELDAALEASTRDDGAPTTPLSDASSDAPTDSAALPYDSSVCVVLPDALFPMFSQQASAGLVYGSLNDAGCASQDGGEDPASNFYSFSDGAPVLHSGQRYAFAWTETSVIQKLTLYGGDVPCALSLLTDQLRTPTGGLQLGAGCLDFVSPREARYLLVPEGNGSRLIAGHNFKLCEGPCTGP